MVSDLATHTGDEVEFPATSEQFDATSFLEFIIPGFSSPTGSGPGGGSTTPETAPQLLALSESSLALVGSLLETVLNTSTTATLRA